MPFYIELPGDREGSVMLPRAVFEGRIVQGGTPEAGLYSNPARQALIITAPADIARKHEGMYTDAFGGFAEVPGPARRLSEPEWDALVAAVLAGKRLPLSPACYADPPHKPTEGETRPMHTRTRLTAVLALAAALALAGCSAARQAPPPQPQPTGPYATAGMSGHDCGHTGPGWLVVPEGPTGQIFHVRDAMYCAGVTGAAVTPVAGKPFSLYYQFSFSKTDPAG